MSETSGNRWVAYGAGVELPFADLDICAFALVRRAFFSSSWRPWPALQCFRFLLVRRVFLSSWRWWFCDLLHILENIGVFYAEFYNKLRQHFDSITTDQRSA